MDVFADAGMSVDLGRPAGASELVAVWVSVAVK